MRQKRTLIIYNPVSGKGIKNFVLDKYKKILHEKGYSVDIVTTKYSNHATEAIYNACEYDIVFVVGGDGTLNEAVRGNYLRDKRLTICPLPSGTCNDVASMLGYGNNPVINLNMALDGEVHDIDIGTINDTPFAYVVGTGKFMNIPYETKIEDKRKNGYFAYLKEGIDELLSQIKRYRTEVLVDGVKMDGKYSLIMVSNSNHIAGINGFHKNVYLNDGKMEVLLCKASNKRGFVLDFLKYFMGIKSDNIVSLKGHEVTINFLDIPDKNFCIDGEKYDYTGTEYVIKIKDKMEFLTPKVKAKDLFRSDGRYWRI